MADPNSRDVASFQLKKEGAAFYKLTVNYRETEARFLFPRGDHGLQEMTNLLGSLPKITGAALREAKVREEMENIDAEIEGLLGESE